MATAERTPSDNERRARHVAASQHGVLSRDQARNAGISNAAIARRVSAGLWARVLPGVYRVTGAPPSDRHLAMAATLWAGEGSVVSHGAAAVLWGIEAVRGTKVELWIPSPRHRRHEFVVVHRGTRIDRADRTTDGPIPVTTPIRTLIDVAGRLEDERLLAAMESVFRQGLGTPERLRARLDALRSSGRPGAGRLEELLAKRGDGRPLEFALEAKIWLLLSRSSLRHPARQHWVTTTGGRYRLDFAWPEEKLGLEADSWKHHGDRAAFGKDRARLSEMVAAGWRVLLVTWDVATRDPKRVLRWVESALDQSAA